MKQKTLLLVFTMFVVALQGMAQSASETADRIGMVGFWKMMEMSGKSGGQEFSYELDGNSFYIFKNNGTCQYSTRERKIADAKWTLKGKELHIWGKDIANAPDGIDHTFTLVMVTPQKLVIKMGDEEEYVYTTLRKSNATLRQVGGPAKKRTSTRRK